LSVVLLGGAAAVWWWWYWYGAGAPQPPEVDTSNREAEVAAAVAAARAEVRKQRRSGPAWGRLGMVLLAHDYVDQAQVCFTRAEQLDPQNPRWPYLNGRLVQMRNPWEALPWLRRGAERAGRTSAPRLHLAETLLGLGEADEAAAEFRRVLAEEPGQPRALLGLGRIAYQQNDLDAALDQVRPAVESVPDLRSARALLVEIYRRRGDARAEQRELALLPRCRDLDWPDPYMMEIEEHLVGTPGRLAEARRLRREGRPHEAAEVLQAAVQAAPQSFEVRLLLGRQLAELGDLPGAEAQIEEALRLRPDWFEALGELGMVLQRQKKYREAADRYRRVLALKPDHALAHFNLSHCREKLGDRAGAVESLRAALKCKPELAWAHQVLGRLLAESGQDALAAEHLQNALRLGLDDVETKALLARVQARLPLPEKPQGK
jgi:tetratricopeptide (TPR) repeat protein